MSAPGQDAAQPSTASDGQGQGQDRAFSSILGQDAFSNAPEELRPHLEEYVRTQVDPRLTQRFQDHAQFRQTWEPFSQVQGLSDLPVESVDDLVGFYDLTLAAQEGNEEAKQALAEWIQTVGTELGLFEDEGEDEDNGTDDEPQYMTREEFEAELAQRDQQGQMQQSTQQHQAEIASFVEKLELPGDPGSDEREEAVADVYTFMQRYAEDPNITNEQLVQQAFEDYQRLTGGAQRRLLEEGQEKSNGTNLKGGGPDTAPEEVKSWADADKLAKARMGAT